MKFILASNNEHKLIEFRRILAPLNMEIVTQDDMGVKGFDPLESANTFAGNAEIKAREMLRLSGLPSIADDSGLMIDALGGEPGVYSARYAGEGASDADRHNLVLQKLKDVPMEKRTARFVSSICCVFPDNDKIVASEGYCEGKIAFEPKGSNGFGYDPIFLPDEYNMEKTFAQLEDFQKDRISHRGQSLKLFYKKMEKILKEWQND